MTEPTDAVVEQPERSSGPPRRVLIGLLLALVLVGLGLVSAALFSDTTGATGLQVGAGTVDLATAPVTLPLDVQAMVPGDVVATTIDVTNDGSLELRWSMTSTVDDTALGDLLELEVRTGVTSCDPLDADSDGTLLAGPARLGGLTADPVVGDPARGEDPGDRTLAPGASDQLCLRIELPDTVEEAEAAGLTVGVELQFDAEQTAANP